MGDPGATQGWLAYEAHALHMPRENPSLPRTQTPPFPLRIRLSIQYTLLFYQLDSLSISSPYTLYYIQCHLSLYAPNNFTYLTPNKGLVLSSFT